MRERVVLQLARGGALPTADALGALGAGGVACDAGDLAMLLPHLTEKRIRLAALIAAIDVRNAASELIVHETLTAAEQTGSPLLLLRLTSGDRYDKPSAPRAMPAAAAAVKRLADVARRHGCSIALEASAGTWMRHPEDAVRVAMRVNRMDVGVAVCLNDFAADDPETLAQRLRLITPKLLAVRASSRVLPAARPGGHETAGPWRALVAAGYTGLVLINE